jgi:hypothetical protein
MPIIVVDVDVVHFCRRAAKIMKALPALRSLVESYRQAHQIALPVIGQKWACRQSRGVNIEGAQAREIIG